MSKIIIFVKPYKNIRLNKVKQVLVLFGSKMVVIKKAEA